MSDDLRARLHALVERTPAVGASEARERARHATPDAPRRHHRRTAQLAVAAVVAALSLAAVASLLGDDDGSDRVSLGKSPAEPPNGSYRVTAIVVDYGGGDVQLCRGDLSEARPVCEASWRLQGFDLGSVADVQTDGEARWEVFTVEGSWQGGTLRVTAPGVPTQNEPSRDQLPPTPCDADSVGTAPEDLGAIEAAVSAEPDFAGAWLDPASGVVNVAFTDDVDGHRAELTAQFGAGICVFQRERSVRELEQTRDELLAAGSPEGNAILSVRMSEARAEVVVDAVFEDRKLLAWIAGHAPYPEIVRVVPFFAPVEAP